MNESNPGNVLSGFEILLEELEAEIDICTRSGARAFENRDFGKAEAAIARAKMVTEFRDKVADLRKQWDAIGGADYDQDEEAKVERQNLGRLRRGLRTSETDFICRFSRRSMSLVAVPRGRASLARFTRP